MAKAIKAQMAREEYLERLVIGFAAFKPLWVACDHCQKSVPSDMEWQCGACEEENRKTTMYSFLNKCHACKASPLSFLCPHCRKITCLTKSADKSKPARKLGTAPQRPEEASEHPSLMRRLQEETLELQQRIANLKLAAELENIEGALKKPEQKSELERLKESARQRREAVLGAYQVVEEMKRENAEIFKDNDEALQRANDALDAWLEENIN